MVTAPPRVGRTDLPMPDRSLNWEPDASVGGHRQDVDVSDRWDDFVDPLSPAGIGWAEWLCPECGEDGERSDLKHGRCPNCGGAVDLG